MEVLSAHVGRSSVHASSRPYADNHGDLTPEVNGPYKPDREGKSRSALRNICLSYLGNVASKDEEVEFACPVCHRDPLGCQLECQNFAEEETAFPAGSELFQEIPESDEGSEEDKKSQALLRVHKILGHPSSRLLTQILKEANAPDNIT